MLLSCDKAVTLNFKLMFFEVTLQNDSFCPFNAELGSCKNKQKPGFRI